MKTMWTMAKRFLKSEDGPTATEYAVMLALIIVALITTIGLLETGIESTFTDVTNAL